MLKPYSLFRKRYLRMFVVIIEYTYFTFAFAYSMSRKNNNAIDIERDKYWMSMCSKKMCNVNCVNVICRSSIMERIGTKETDQSEREKDRSNSYYSEGGILMLPKMTSNRRKNTQKRTSTNTYTRAQGLAVYFETASRATSQMPDHVEVDMLFPSPIGRHWHRTHNNK